MKTEIGLQIGIKLLTLSILTGALIFGIVRFLIRNTPMYFRILTCAVGCYVLTFLFETIFLLCYDEIYADYIITAAGYFGCSMLLFAAEGGAFDRIVDDERDPSMKKYRWIALIAPAVFTVFVVLFGMRAFADGGIFATVLSVIAVLPVIPGSYFQLNHLIMPDRGDRFLHSARPCIAITLVFSVIELLQGFILCYDGSLLDQIFNLTGAVFLLLLMIFANRGCRQWTT